MSQIFDVLALVVCSELISHFLMPNPLCPVRITSSFHLGGFLRLVGPSEEEANTLLKLVAGIYITQKCDMGSIYVPPFLQYNYVPESPVLLEGSILKNLLLSVSSEDRHCGSEPTADEAWEIARMCGLDGKRISVQPKREELC